MLILRIVAAKGIDLVVLGSNPPRYANRLVFSSTTEEVLRKACCPVLTASAAADSVPESHGLEGPVLFATDFNVKTIEAVRYAGSISGRLGVPLECLHVLPRSVESEHNPAIPGILIDALHQVAIRSEAGVEPRCAIVYGNEVSNAVVDHARQLHAGLIVLGVRRSSMVAADLPTHISYRILIGAPCPVLTVAYPCEVQSDTSARLPLLRARFSVV